MCQNQMWGEFFKRWIPMVTSPQLKGGISMNKSLKQPLVMTK